LIVVALLVVAAAVYWAAQQIVAEMKAAREEAARTRAIALLQLLAPGLGASAQDPRALLVWHPIAKIARQMFPAEFASLDRGAGGTFPFTKEQLQAAHAEWTADWLGWERAHDAEYKLKVAALEHELGTANTVSAPSLARARFEAIEREKLDLYQRRYQEYVRIAKALQAITA
jgi:hypothetical protein